MFYFQGEIYEDIESINMDIDEFIDAYVTYYKELSGETKKVRGVDHSWSIDYMELILEYKPEYFFEIMKLIREKDDSDAMLRTLAVGPIQQMLSAGAGFNHGHRIIATLETLAHNDPRFKDALWYIDAVRMADGVYERLQELVRPTVYPNRKARRKAEREKSKKMRASDYRKK